MEVHSGGRFGGYRDLVLFLVAGVGMTVYATVTPPAAGDEMYAWLRPLGELGGDFKTYFWRFLASFTLLGLLPFCAAVLCGHRPRDFGIARPRRFARWWVWLFLALLAVVIAVCGAYDPETSRYYPYSKSLVQTVAERGAGPFVLHAVLYLLMFYVPWEVLFRGILLFPVVRLAGNQPRATLICLAALQALPSGLLHVGHPAVETIGSVAFGVAAGAVTLMSGSIVPGLAIHAGIGILQDALLVLRSISVLP